MPIHTSRAPGAPLTAALAVTLLAVGVALGVTATPASGTNLIGAPLLIVAASGILARLHHTQTRSH